MKLSKLIFLAFLLLVQKPSHADFVNSNHNLWIGAFAKQSQRMVTLPCEMTTPLNGKDFSVNHWDLTRATATYFCFEVYVPGITDHQDSHPAALVVDGQLQGASDKLKIIERIQFAGVRGNNFVYALAAEDLGINQYTSESFEASLSIRVRSRLFNIGDSLAEDLIKVAKKR